MEEETEMKNKKLTFSLCLVLVFFFAAYALAGYAYKANKDHIGGDLAPADAQLGQSRQQPRHERVLTRRQVNLRRQK